MLMDDRERIVFGSVTQCHHEARVEGINNNCCNKKDVCLSKNVRLM